MSNLLTSAEVAQRLRVRPATIRTYVSNGELKSVKLGRQHRFEESSVDDFIRKQKRSK